MAYAKRHHSTFQALGGNTFTVEIYEDGYGGASTEITLGGTPVIANWGSEGDGLLQSHRALTASVQIVMAKGSAEETLVDDIIASDDAQFAVKLVEGSTTHWFGPVKSEGVEKPIGTGAQVATIFVSDGIELIRLVGTSFSGRQPVLTLIVELLNKLNLGLPFTTSFNWYPVGEGFTSSDDVLTKIDIDVTQLIARLQDEAQDASGYNLLRTVLESFQLRLSQAAGYGWLIEQRAQKFNSSQPIWKYNSSGVFQSTDTISSIAYDDVNLKQQDGQTTEWLRRSYKKARLVYNHGVYSDNLLENSDFDEFDSGVPEFTSWTASGFTPSIGSVGDPYGQACEMPINVDLWVDPVDRQVFYRTLVTEYISQRSTLFVGGNTGDTLRLQARALGRAAAESGLRDLEIDNFYTWYSLQLDTKWLNRNTMTFDDVSFGEDNKIPVNYQINELCNVNEEFDISSVRGQVEVRLWATIDDHTPNEIYPGAPRNLTSFAWDGVRLDFLPGGTAENTKKIEVVYETGLIPGNIDEYLVDKDFYVGDGPHVEHASRIEIISNGNETQEWKLDNSTADGSELPSLYRLWGKQGLRQIVSPLRCFRRSFRVTGGFPIESYRAVEEDGWNYDPVWLRRDYRNGVCLGEFTQVRQDSISPGIEEDLIPNTDGTFYPPNIPPRLRLPSAPLYEVQVSRRGLVFSTGNRKPDWSNRVYYPFWGGSYYGSIEPDEQAWITEGLQRTGAGTTGCQFSDSMIASASGLSVMFLVRMDENSDNVEYFSWGIGGAQRSRLMARGSGNSNNISAYVYDDSDTLDALPVASQANGEWAIVAMSIDWSSKRRYVWVLNEDGTLNQSTDIMTGTFTAANLVDPVVQKQNDSTIAATLIYNTAITYPEFVENARALATFAWRIGVQINTEELTFFLQRPTPLVQRGLVLDWQMEFINLPVLTFLERALVDSSGPPAHTGVITGTMGQHFLNEEDTNGLTKLVDDATKYAQAQDVLGGSTITTGFTIMGLFYVPSDTNDSCYVHDNNGTGNLVDAYVGATGDNLVLVVADDAGTTTTIDFGAGSISAGSWCLWALAVDLRNSRYYASVVSQHQYWLNLYESGDLSGASTYSDNYSRLLPEGAWSCRRFAMWEIPLTPSEILNNYLAIGEWAQQYGIDIGAIGEKVDDPFRYGSGSMPELSDLAPRMDYAYPFYPSTTDDYKVVNVAPGTRNDTSSHGRLEASAGEPFQYFKYTANGLERFGTSASEYLAFPNAVVGGGTLGDFSVLLVGKDALDFSRPFELSAGTNTNIQVKQSSTNKVQVILTNSAAATFTADLAPSGYVDQDWAMVGLAYDHSAQTVTAWALSDTGTIVEATATATGTMETSINWVRGFTFRQSTLRLIGFSPGRLMTASNFKSNARYLYPWLLQFGIDLNYEGVGIRIDANTDDIATNTSGISVLSTDMATEEAIKKFRTSDIRVRHTPTTGHQTNVQWAAGTVKYADSNNNVTTYNVAAATSYTLTGGAGTRTWIYLDPTVSTTVLQKTTTWPPATIRYDQTLIAICTYGESGEFASIYNVFEQQVIAASEIYANYLSSITADFGLITSGEARFGTGTVGVNFSGVRIYTSGIEGYNSEVLQVTIDASDGTLIAGAGYVTMDVDGLSIIEDTSISASRKIQWLDNTTSAERFALGSDSVSGAFISGSGRQIYIDSDVTLNLACDTSIIDMTVSAIDIFTTANNAPITLTPHGTGYVEIDGMKWPTSPGTSGYVLRTDGVNQLSWVANAGSMSSWVLAVSDTAGTESITDGETVTINGSAGIDVTRSTNTVTVALDLLELTSGDLIASGDHMLFHDLTDGGKKRNTLSEVISQGLNAVSTVTTLTNDALSSVKLYVLDGTTVKKITLKDLFTEVFTDNAPVASASGDDFLGRDDTDGVIKTLQR